MIPAGPAPATTVWYMSRLGVVMLSPESFGLSRSLGYSWRDFAFLPGGQWRISDHVAC